MTLLFGLELSLFFLSLVLLSAAANRFIRRWPGIDPSCLPRLAWGWLVYLCLYLAGQWAAISTDALRRTYMAVAFGVPIATTGLWLARRLTRRTGAAHLEPGSEPAAEPWTLILVALFAAAMIVTGPYLEFPADSVEYLYRVQAWERARLMTYAYPRPHRTSARSPSTGC